MARFFTRRASTETRPRPKTPSSPLTSPTDLRCDSYGPGHQMHYIHQGQALRSPSRQARNVIVDGQRVIVLLEDGDQLDFTYHDPERLGTVLGLFPAARVLYHRFHALRVGPYWFNLAPDELFEPCEHGTGS